MKLYHDTQYLLLINKHTFIICSLNTVISSLISFLVIIITRKWYYYDVILSLYDCGKTVFLLADSNTQWLRQNHRAQIPIPIVSSCFFADVYGIFYVLPYQHTTLGIDAITLASNWQQKLTSLWKAVTSENYCFKCNIQEGIIFLSGKNTNDLIQSL